MVLGTFGIQVACGATIGVFVVLLGDDLGAVGAQIANPWTLSIVNVLALGLIITIGRRATRETATQFFAIRSFPKTLIAPVIVTSIGLALVSAEIDNLVAEALSLLPNSSHVRSLLIDLGTSPFAAFLLTIVVAPLTEEYLFRGMILRGLLTRHRVAFAIGANAVLFAIMHANVRQLFLALMLGAVFGWWYYRTKSVGPGLLGHAIFNLGGWASAVFYDVTPEYWLHGVGDQIVHQPWLFTVAGLFAVGVGIYQFHHAAPFRAEPVPSTPDEPPLLPLVVPSLEASVEPPVIQPSDSPRS